MKYVSVSCENQLLLVHLNNFVFVFFVKLAYHILFKSHLSIISPKPIVSFNSISFLPTPLVFQNGVNLFSKEHLKKHLLNPVLKPFSKKKKSVEKTC